jgi:hypothetical protein
MDVRIEQFERLWVNRARLPRLTTFDFEPLAPQRLGPQRLGQQRLGQIDLGTPPPRPDFPLIRMTNDPEDIFPVLTLVRQTNRHELLSPNRLKEWWEADGPTRDRIMREDGVE